MIVALRRAAALALSGLLAAPLPAAEPGLRITLAQPLNGASPRVLALRVEDASGRPAAGATLTIRLPDTAPSGTFASGLRSEIVTAGPKGEVTLAGLRWAGGPGINSIAITATLKGARGEMALPVEIGAQAAEQMEKPSARGGMKWLWIALIAGGAAGGAVAFAGKAPGSAVSSPAAIIQPPTVTPTIGVPTVTVSRP